MRLSEKIRKNAGVLGWLEYVPKLMIQLIKNNPMSTLGWGGGPKRPEYIKFNAERGIQVWSEMLENIRSFDLKVTNSLEKILALFLNTIRKFGSGGKKFADWIEGKMPGKALTVPSTQTLPSFFESYGSTSNSIELLTKKIELIKGNIDDLPQQEAVYTILDEADEVLKSVEAERRRIIDEPKQDQIRDAVFTIMENIDKLKDRNIQIINITPKSGADANVEVAEILEAINESLQELTQITYED